MKKFAVLFLVLVIVAVGCGTPTDKKPDTGNKDTTNPTKPTDPAKEDRPQKIDGFVLYTTPEGTSFYVPDGWKSISLKFPPLDPNLVKAGAETIFFPPELEAKDIQAKFYSQDFRYIENLDFGGKTLLVYMQGSTNRYMPGACKNYPQITFYENGESNYEAFEIPYSKDLNTEACWATLRPPALKFGGEAFVYIAYGQRIATTQQPMTQFSGIALTGKSLSGADRDMFEKIAKSFRF
jgi:hypothetical protein